MTDAPELKIVYKTSLELEQLFVEHQFEGVLGKCNRREIVNGTFYLGKHMHPTTVREIGEVYKDGTGVRAVIFHYIHSDKTSVRSIKRLVADNDYRLPQPDASSPDLHKK
jgi:hypothetical protein